MPTLVLIVLFLMSIDNQLFKFLKTAITNSGTLPFFFKHPSIKKTNTSDTLSKSCGSEEGCYIPLCSSSINSHFAFSQEYWKTIVEPPPLPNINSLFL